MIIILNFVKTFYQILIFFGFHNSKNLNCIGALSFLLRLEGDYCRSPFLINFFGVNFEAGNETCEKICNDFVPQQNEE